MLFAMAGPVRDEPLGEEPRVKIARRATFSRHGALRASILALALVFLGCDDESVSAAADGVSLPTLVLTDQTPHLLLTWIDERGGTHTATSLVEIPASARSLVRVITKDAGHGALFYVADLDKKNDDGSYDVRTMKRADWEALIAERREAWRLAHAPPPAPPAPATATAAPSAAPTASVAGLQVIVYGAEWCTPCHDAAAYLRNKGVRVVEYDIEKEPDRGREMQRKLRNAGMTGGSIPVLDIGGAILRGFSTTAIDRALQRAAQGEAL
jgi:glutaredoxin